MKNTQKLSNFKFEKKVEIKSIDITDIKISEKNLFPIEVDAIACIDNFVNSGTLK